MKKGYVIMFTETLSAPYVFYMPSLPVPFKAYESLAEGKAALVKAMATFDRSTLIQYGEAFPYDNTTFDQHLTEKGFAIHGLGEKVIDDEVFSVGVALVVIELP